MPFIDLEQNGALREEEHALQDSHSDMLFVAGDRNIGQRLRNITQERSEQETINWNVYNEQIDSTCDILQDNIKPVICYSAALPMLGAAAGMLVNFTSNSNSTESAFECTAIGITGGATVAMATLCGIVQIRKARQNKFNKERRRQIDTLPYSQLSLSGNKGIHNAPALEEDLCKALVRILESFPRSPENDRRVADFLLILHDDPTSDATKDLADTLNRLPDRYVAGELSTEQALAHHFDGLIKDWKSRKTRDFTALVLHKGLAAPGSPIPGKDWSSQHGTLVNASGKVSDYLSLKNADLPAPTVKEGRLSDAVQHLGKYPPWHEHLEKHVPGYAEQQSQVQGLLTLAEEKLFDKREALSNNAFKVGCDHLLNGSKGNLLAQWYAQECFKNPGFIASKNDEWVKDKLIAEFYCPGLSESDIGSLIDEAFPDYKGTYVRENVQTLENESAGGSRQREVNVSSFPMISNVDA